MKYFSRYTTEHFKSILIMELNFLAEKTTFVKRVMNVQWCLRIECILSLENNKACYKCIYLYIYLVSSWSSTIFLDPYTLKAQI